MRLFIGLIFTVALTAQNRSTPLVILPSADDATPGQLRLREKRANGINYAGFASPPALGANIIWTVPTADGTVGDCWKTDGAGGLYFETCGGSVGLHASTHQNGGADEVATATPSANAIPKAGAAGTLGAGWIPDLSGTYQVSDSDLAAIAALNCTENQIIKRNAVPAWVCAADSGTGGASASEDLTDFAQTVGMTDHTDDTLTIETGRARIGGYTPVVISTGSVHFTSGSGNVKVFINQDNTLVCHKATGIGSTETGSMACSNVTTPAFPVNSIPIADVTVNTSQAITSVVDYRAFFSTRAIAAATGISISDAGGLASVGIDTQTVPTLGGTNSFTGTVDLSQATVTPMTKHRTFQFTATVLDPVVGDDRKIMLYNPPSAITVTRFTCNVLGATNVVVNLVQATEASPEGAGTDVMTADATCTAGAMITPVTSFADATVPAHNPLMLHVHSVSGTNTALRITFEYTID